MKKQLLAAFLCGLVIPLSLIAVGMGSKTEQIPLPSGEPEQTQAQIQPQEEYDTQTVVAVEQDGQSAAMPLRDYLVGVVLAEMPADFQPEALQAQAVVARTYTCKRAHNAKHDDGAVCTDPSCCQGYWSTQDYLDQGGTQAQIDRVCQAVEQTDGMVLTYQGELIDATYFSCSGGSTEDAVEVWGQDVPYLQAVESPGEEQAPRYRERLYFTPEEFLQRTGCAGGQDPQEWFGTVTYTDGGGVDTMELCGQIYSGVELRSLLGLRSTVFTMTAEDGQIVVDTRGFGHRVGMSQYGAQAMAQQGGTWREILSHYYQGTEVIHMKKFENRG